MNELALRSWQGVVSQIPGTLTGLGLLGTFIGLLTGIGSVQVSSVDATLESIVMLFYSLSNAEAGLAGGSGSESVLMPQILNGLQNHEFTFYLQPRYDLNTQKIIGAEALVRWIHPKLGMVAPSVFIPALEKNGYITKLDQYIWNQICAKMRQWIDAGIRPVPISVNISKTDIMALDSSWSWSVTRRQSW